MTAPSEETPGHEQATEQENAVQAQVGSPHEQLTTKRSTTGQLETYTQRLARRHAVQARTGGQLQYPLLERLETQRALLQDAHGRFRRASAAELTRSYAAEWILDNFYIVEQTFRQIEEDMPAGFYRQLPKLAEGSMAGVPRIYAVAQGMIDYWDGQLDYERTCRFLLAYQQTTYLTMGELWALPVMLRLALLEELTVAVSSITDLNIGSNFAPGTVLSTRIDHETVVAIVIPNLRALSTVEWKDLFERTSIVEKKLAKDPAGIYSRMDFDTRNHYREIVETLALATGEPEEEVAAMVVQLAEEARKAGVPDFDAPEISPGAEIPEAKARARNNLLKIPRAVHVGYYLLEQGRRDLHSRLNYRPSPGQWLKEWILRHPLIFYLGSIGLLSLLFLVLLVQYGEAVGASVWQRLFVLLLGSVPAVTVAVNLVDGWVTHLLPPRVLPKMNFSDGIPDEVRTIVVVPALLAGQEEIASLLQQLERHYLANADRNLRFALLTDFVDAPQQQMSEDEALLEMTKISIEQLNTKHAPQCGYAPFYLFHRERRWNPGEGCWIGWERKRGKLAEFNRLLLGQGETSYSVQLGDLGLLRTFRYVITLDTDTILAPETARRLIATLAHPLNRAHFDPHTGKVAAGYTVLQPRVEIEPVSTNRSSFARIFAGETGLDLYTRAVSDVYQDLFGEGIYAGKGIYDVDVFERSLTDRVPENTLLSHDLFEGIHGRAGLVTDVPLYEEYPDHYLVYARRLHRWVRGDWQILLWLMRYVPCAGSEGTIRNDLSLLSRWKILDNLRRSLFPPTLLLFWMVAWPGWLSGMAWVWTLLGLVVLFIPTLRAFITEIVRNAGGFEDSWNKTIKRSLQRQLLILVFLPHRSYITVDAIVRSLLRLFVTRRQLLEWTTAAHASRHIASQKESRFVWRNMISAPLISLVTGLLVWLVNDSALPVVLPLLLLWFVSPQIAHWISQPQLFAPASLDDVERQDLRRIARATWLFFEHFVGPQDHWLPPDHFQESPRGLVAHRTSPTNIGLLLTSTLGAWDLGYVGPVDLAALLLETFETMEQMEKYRGHILNWFDTSNLHPLLPRYVSTVDSGNLAACLLVVGQGMPEVLTRPLLGHRRWQGLLDTLDMLQTNLQMHQARLTAQTKTTPPIVTTLDQIVGDVQVLAQEPESWPTLLERLYSHTWPEFEEQIGETIARHSDLLDVEGLRSLRVWTERVRAHLAAAHRDAQTLLPWVYLLADSSPTWTSKEGWNEFLAGLPSNVESGSLAPEQIPAICQEALRRLDALQIRLDAGDESHRQWCREWIERIEGARHGAEALIRSCQTLAKYADQMINEMDFAFLYDEQRQVFHLGYNVTAETLDANYYDLMASEARIASLIAIAKGDVPLSHWLHLGRPLTQVNGMRALLSWSATMFEYLMPPLFMRSNPGTLLHESAIAAVKRQIDYAREHQIPWGISESGYYQFDASQNYQYRAFGVPGLGFKRGLGDDLVVAPYASLLAISIHPRAVMENIRQLRALGMEGLYGFYEAIDFTDTRLPLGQAHAHIYSFMAHHQGMALMALVNYLEEEPMVRRFHSAARIQTVELLLHEGVPASVPIQNPTDVTVPDVHPEQPQVVLAPWEVPVETPMPQVRYLSNGRYGVMITNAGAGYSVWNDVALTRWRADTTLDNWGQWVYLRDRESGEIWSATPQPVPSAMAKHEVFFHPHMVEFRCQAHGIVLNMKVTVSLDDDVEIREVTLTNSSDRPRALDVVSYGEVVLGDQNADLRHQAFNKMFIQSEYLPEIQAILFWRRQRSAHEEPRLMAHLLLSEEVPGEQVDPGSRASTGAGLRYETDRRRFLGRHGSYADPAALRPGGELTNTAGATLDPVMSIGKGLTLLPHQTVRLAFVTIAARSRQRLVEVAEHYRSWSTLRHAFDQSRTRLEHAMRQVHLSIDELQDHARLLSLLIYPSPVLRADRAILVRNRKGQSSLWPYAISGDYPILLVRVHELEQLALVHRLLRIHRHWRRQGLKIDLVILNLHDTGYNQALHESTINLLIRQGSENWLNQRGGIFLVRTKQLSDEDRVLLETAARVVLDGEQGDLAAQLADIFRQPTPLPPLTPSLPAAEVSSLQPLEPSVGLQFDNGYGGFNEDGNEYVIDWKPGKNTPVPWINVIANPQFGFLVSEAGSGYTWAENSGENRLTPWNNDPIQDPPGEVLYLRDEETGAIWSPTPLPSPPPADKEETEGGIRIRHGNGYSIFEHHSHSLEQEVRLFTTVNDPVKIVQLRLANHTDRPRRLTATYYAEWVLGPTREMMQQYVVPEFDHEHQALLAYNRYNTEFADRAAFVAASQDAHGITTDRTEFLGRLGNYRSPLALGRIGLSGRVEPGVDPCVAYQIHIDLLPGETKAVHFLIGQGEDRRHALELVERYFSGAAVEEAWQTWIQFWDRVLGKVQVQTPDPAMDLMLNRWLLYQALSCRIWGRSAFYQSSGAFGFRDQLQDVLSAIHALPDEARQQICRAARHQFIEGDVLHWWHPPSGRGVRTRITDDLLWLPFVTAEYVASTGDESVLWEEEPFLVGEPLRPDEEERYGHYDHSEEHYPVFEHCRRALAKGWERRSNRGLPLIGGGDWNDGMNRVGVEGKGESIWLGWFLYRCLVDFADLCRRVDKQEDAEQYQQWAADLQMALEAYAWDGDWYLRATYDDGTPLGSHRNEECQIDAIAQSWSVISGAGDPQRAQQAMASVGERLICTEEQLLLLFTPPFDKTPKDPGYIKGYLPGIRENGGHYTHAATWTVWAYTQLGQGDRALELFGFLNPINRSRTVDAARRYRVEPYVVAADIYSVPPHVGHGGWTWYTGSSGWLYRLGVEAILGLSRAGNTLHVDPCIPRDWPGYDLTYREGKAVYHIRVDNRAGVNRGVVRVMVDGKETDGAIPLRDDGKEHKVVVLMG